MKLDRGFSPMGQCRLARAVKASAKPAVGCDTILAMTFPIGSLQADEAPVTRRERVRAVSAVPPDDARPRGRTTLRLVLGAVIWLMCLLALLSHQRTDPGFSTSGVVPGARNLIGVFGAWLSDIGYFCFGLSVWWLMLVSARTWLGVLADGLRGAEAQPGAPRRFSADFSANWRFWLGLIVLMVASCTLEWTRLYRFEPALPGPSGGVLGQVLGVAAMRYLGFIGSGLLGVCLFVAGLSLALRFSWLDLADRLGERVDQWRQQRREAADREEDARVGQQAAIERDVIAEEQLQAPAPPPVVIEPMLVEVPRSERVAQERQQLLFAQGLGETRLPQVDLLDAAQSQKETVTPESLEMTSRLIEKKLGDFGVVVRVVAASPGPVITRYEIEPDVGVKGSQVVNLATDLARSLSLARVRVVETIPGRSTMALELPNARRQSIRLSEILGSKVYHDAASLLTMGLGKDIVGAPVVADLAKMPHCLVAGTTGSGKSVGINAMILSLLYKAEARDVRLILIDPKMLEMSVYEGIPHLLCPVVTDMKQAANALTWCVAEMERRYRLMSKMGVRQLSGFNRKIDEAAEAGQLIPNPFSLTPEEPEPLERLPFIVVVIDELADLMMVVGKKIEELIARLAQKARAAGIHLVLATQRPSVDVITGLIKANIPTRLSFQVNSKIDSRTILDQMGAEALLGQGDMLYLAPGTGLPMRVHGAFVSDEEVHRVVEYLKEQGEPNYIEGILEGGTLDGEGEGGAASVEGGDGEADAMYDQAVAIVLQHRKASISLVQRHLRIGYNRAARLLEQMEKSGLVSSMSTNGNRDLLVPSRQEG
jgi:DNA segregation ATPase FtsK/SpoIIIE, S-DNA-T family